MISKRFTSIQLGIDLGGSKLALALAAGEGGLVARWRRPTQPSGDPVRDVARIVDDAAAFLAKNGVDASAVECVGLSVPGPIDAERGILQGPPNLPGWRDVPIRDWIGDALGRPVRMENDANAAVLAEWRFGAGRGFFDVAYLTMSTGVGGGLVLGGRLHRGHGGNAGEIGHVPVEWDGEPCVCGQRGCLEAYVGGAAWTRRLRERVPADSSVATLAEGRERVSPAHVVAAALTGDAFALAEIERFNHYLARGITALTFSLAPQLVVLGTIPTAMGEALCFEPLRALVRERVWPVLCRDLRIEPSGLGEDLPYYAGVCVALEGVLD